jgi:hypothetical protein
MYLPSFPQNTKLGNQIPLGFQRLVGFVATQRWRTDTNLNQPITTKTTTQHERKREREREQKRASYDGEKALLFFFFFMGWESLSSLSAIARGLSRAPGEHGNGGQPVPATAYTRSHNGLDA